MQNHGEELGAVMDQYEARFKRPAPLPYGITGQRLLALLRRALETGDPDLDPHADLPADSNA